MASVHALKLKEFVDWLYVIDLTSSAFFFFCSRIISFSYSNCARIPEHTWVVFFLILSSVITVFQNKRNVYSVDGDWNGKKKLKKKNCSNILYSILTFKSNFSLVFIITKLCFFSFFLSLFQVSHHTNTLPNTWEKWERNLSQTYWVNKKKKIQMLSLRQWNAGLLWQKKMNSTIPLIGCGQIKSVYVMFGNK